MMFIYIYTVYIYIILYENLFLWVILQLLNRIIMKINGPSIALRLRRQVAQKAQAQAQAAAQCVLDDGGIWIYGMKWLPSGN